MPQRQCRDCKRKDIALDEGAGEQGPRVDERHGRHEGQVWHHEDVAAGGPSSVADDGAEKGLHDEKDQSCASYGRDVEPWRHGDGLDEVGDVVEPLKG